MTKGDHPVAGQIYVKKIEILGDNNKERYQLYIADAIEFLAGNTEECDRIISKIDIVESGNADEVVVEGLDTTLIIKKDGVQVNIYINDDWVNKPDGKFSTTEWKRALIAWKKFLSLPTSLSSEVEATIKE